MSTKTPKHVPALEAASTLNSGQLREAARLANDFVRWFRAFADAPKTGVPLPESGEVPAEYQAASCSLVEAQQALLRLYGHPIMAEPTGSGRNSTVACLRGAISRVWRESDAVPHPLGWVPDVQRISREAIDSLEREAIHATVYVDALEAAAHAPEVPPRGKPGRRGYPREALEYARKLRNQHPTMKAHAIRQKCLACFPEDDLPPDAAAFRAWMNRTHKRTNHTD